MTRKAGLVAVGDVVMIKSGGPLMVVEQIGVTSAPASAEPPDGVLCVWFRADELQQRRIPSACLQVVMTSEQRAVN